jgi:hypothetical protein
LIRQIALVCRHPAADRGTAAAADSRIDVKRSIALRSIKNQGEVRMDDKKIHNFGARHADVTGLSVPEHHGDSLALPMLVQRSNLSFEIWSSGGCRENGVQFPKPKS